MQKLIRTATSMLIGIATLASCNSLGTLLTERTINATGIASNVSSNGFTMMAIRFKTDVGATSSLQLQGSSSSNTITEGSTVTVSGKTNDDETVSVTTATVKVELKGSISSLDLVNASMVVLGQTIKADANTVFQGSDSSALSLSNLQTNDFVEIYGLRQTDDSLLASRIELEKGTKPSTVEVKGRITNLDSIAKTFVLGTQQIDYSNITPVPTLNNGTRVEAKGTLSNTVLVISKLELTKKATNLGTTGRIEIEGISSNLDATAKTLSIQGYSVNYSNASIEGTPANDARVEVHGTLNADGSITANKLEFSRAKKGYADADAKAEGTISAVNTNTITVASVIYNIDADTVLEKNNRAITLAAVNVGDAVKFKFINSSKLVRKLEVK